MHEEIRDHFKHIKRAERKGLRRGVDRVDIEGEDGMITIKDRQQIDEAIRTANVNKRLQSYNTLLWMEPLRTLIGEKMD